MLTAYSYPMARLLDPHVDILLVGDSLGMVLYGMDSTLGVTLEMMIAHGRAVKRAAERAMVVVDMPFASVQASPEEAFRTCARVMAETGCAAVKIEGGRALAPTVRFLTERGIPVMAHVGLMPQHVHQLGGYGYRGRSATEKQRIMDDAQAMEEAGAFALLLEGLAEPVAREITQRATIPTIGIGASPACDGQVLVTEDLLGLSGGYVPAFVKPYARLSEAVADAVRTYTEEVRSGVFPDAAHCYGVKKEASERREEEPCG